MGMREEIVKALLGKAKAPLAGKIGGPWEGGIRAYHSSPHDFDKVDFSKLRTGEGANVYGAGHYMAENPAVSGQGGEYWKSFRSRFAPAEASAAQRLQARGFDRDQVLADVATDIDYLKRGKNAPSEPHNWMLSDETIRRNLLLRQAEYDLLKSGQPVGPRTYEMNLRAKPEELLDWDKPFSQQPPAVYETLRVLGVPDKPHVTGQMAYRDLGGQAIIRGANPREADRIVSDTLANAGIPGIRYLDEGSRITNPDAQAIISVHGKEGALELARTRLKQADLGSLGYWDKMVRAMEKPTTHNYVGTDPSRLDVLAKYGIAGAAAIPPTLGAFTRQDDYEGAR